MLECDTCKHQTSEPNSFKYQSEKMSYPVFVDKIKCKIHGDKELNELMAGTWMYSDQPCLFFKPHCGKCGGNCANT